MKTQAWDVVLLKTSSNLNYPDTIVKVRLPFNTVKAHLISVNGSHDCYHVDTVFFDSDCDHQYVKRSLVDHDGYPSNIVVRKAR